MVMDIVADDVLVDLMETLGIITVALKLFISNSCVQWPHKALIGFWKAFF